VAKLEAEYRWQLDYLAAILQTEDGRLAHLIYGAQAAIEPKFMSLSNGEHRAESAQEAQRGFLALEAERLR
jgi:hypothetical protein